MPHRLGGFRSPEDAATFTKQYDTFVEDLWPVPHEELDVDTSFGRTHVRRSGTADGVPLLLIHPTSGGSLGWYSVIEPLAAHRTVFTPDTIGTAGRSVQTAPIRSESDLSRWLDDVLDRLGLASVHLVGYSEGGWIAAVHAALTDRAERLATLTLIEPGGAIERIPTVTLLKLIRRAMKVKRAKDKSAALRDLNRWMNGDIELSDEEIDLVIRVFETYRQHLPRPGRLDDEHLRRITTPTLLLLAEDTVIFDPEKVAGRAERLLADVTVDITPNAGHGLVFQYPDRITAKILDFVTNSEDPSTSPSTHVAPDRPSCP